MDEIEQVKAKHLSLRERLAAKRQQRQNLMAGIGLSRQTTLPMSTSSGRGTLQSTVVRTASQTCSISKSVSSASRLCESDGNATHQTNSSSTNIPSACDIASPCKSATNVPSTLLPLKKSSSEILLPDSRTAVSKVSSSTDVTSVKRTHDHGPPESSAKRLPFAQFHCPKTKPAPPAPISTKVSNELEDLLGAQTTREKENKRLREELLELLNTPTAKERYLSERFRSQGGSQVQQFCTQGTRIECSKYKARTGDTEPCIKLHFRKIIHPHTDESLGDCSFLNTCFHVDTCKYVHYCIDYSSSSISTSDHLKNGSIGKRFMRSASAANEPPVTLYPIQWINCDIRLLNMSILGKFAVIMADPPWDIHMELPYGTMSDDEMRRLDIPCLQDDGYIFLWVTGRAMELGRDCLRLWGYERVDEIIWVKTNQLQRLIRTGRTGHWLNHGKEHCLVGMKGNPQGVNRGLDCDVIVSEVRETSHKPDEIYGIIERLSPGTRKLELFGRPHNLQPNWITLGNQLDGTCLVDPAVVERFKKHYPNGLDFKGST